MCDSDTDRVGGCAKKVHKTMRDWMETEMTISCRDDEAWSGTVGTLYSHSSYVRDLVEVLSPEDEILSVKAFNVSVDSVRTVLSRLEDATCLWKTEGHTCDEIESSLTWVTSDCLRFIDMFDLKALSDPLLYLVNTIPMTIGCIYLVMDEVWPVNTDWAGPLVLEWCLMTLVKGSREEGETLLDTLSEELKSDVLHHLFYNSTHCGVVRTCLIEPPGASRDVSILSDRNRRA